MIVTFKDLNKYRPLNFVTKYSNTVNLKEYIRIYSTKIE